MENINIQECTVHKIVHTVDLTKIYLKDYSSSNTKKIVLLSSLICFENVVDILELDRLLIRPCTISSYGLFVCEINNLIPEEFKEIIFFSINNSVVLKGVTKNCAIRDYNSEID